MMILASEVLKQQPLLDLHSLYANGFWRSKISDPLAKNLLSIVRCEKYILDEDASSPVMDASWDHGSSSVDPIRAPMEYRAFYRSFLEQNILFPYTNLFGDFTRIGMALHKTPKGYDNKWHGHFMDGYHLHILIHLTPSFRNTQDGGKIEFGLVLDPKDYSLDQQDYYLKDAKHVFQTGSFLCQNGDFEILLNTHPMYRHQVTTVSSDVDRYTLMIFCGYEDNILSHKSKIRHL